MKYIKYILILVVLVGLAFIIIKKRPETGPGPITEEEVTKTEVAVDVKEPIELCFAKFGTPNKNSFYDQYTLRLILSGEKVTGELNFLPAEKDKKVGEIEGTVGPVDPTMMARKADLWWYSFAEGMNVKEELKIIFGEGTANIGFGEMLDRGDGVYVYKDVNKISYTLDLTDVACSDLVERAKVEEYLQENIGTLSPVKPVLGGKWYYIIATINVAD